MEVGKISFGEIDAKNEVLKQQRVGKTIFKNSFQNPPGIDIDSLLSGENYYIIGQKGCGKTALLLYLQDLCEERNWSTETIFFRSGVSEPERQEVLAGTPYKMIEVDGQSKVHYDFVFNWLWLIYSNILRRVEESWVLEGSDTLRDLKNLLRLTNETKVRVFTDLTAKSIATRAKIALNFKFVTAEIGSDIDFIRDIPQEKLPLEIITICEKHIGKIKLYPKHRVTLSFDELELFHSKQGQRERDLRLITDLLQAVSRTNQVFTQCGAPITVYASVRTEVLQEVNTVLPESWRDIADFGVEVNWNVKASAAEQPILNIVENKIRFSEVDQDENTTDLVWDTYFPDRIYGKNARQYLLDISMFKPRLIIQRLNLAKKYDPSCHFFSDEHFEETSTEFSNEAWREVSEQLLQIYSQKEVTSLREIFKAWKTNFTLYDIEQRVIALNRDFPGTVDSFKNIVQIRKVIDILYETGAVGNRFTVEEKGKSLSRDRWSFRGYKDPIHHKDFCIHESLRKHFQLMHD